MLLRRCSKELRLLQLTQYLDGKKKRRGRTAGTTSKTKKAIVQLTADSKEIEIFEGL